MYCRRWCLTLVVCLALAIPGSLAAQGICQADLDGDVARPYFESSAVFWEPVIDYDQIVLRVDGPCDTIEKVFARGEQVVFDLQEVVGPVDGRYVWELRAVPSVDPETREALTKAHETGDYSIVRKLQDEGRLPVGPFVEGAGFSVVEGRIVPPELGEKAQPLSLRSVGAASASLATSPNAVEGNPLTTKDYLHWEDVLITGSLCVGFDCVDGESFGYDTIRLKENSLRIHFDDTSSAASYPTNNWQIRANDSTNGGTDYLGFVDMGETGSSTGGDLVFAVEAGAPASSLYVDDYGRVGLGTKTPYTEIHVADGDTPTVRLDQDGTSGFAAQSWDLAGNETNFFVRDVTGGSRLVFRIQPGAPTNALAIRNDGDVGLGTWSPAAALHLERDDGTAQVLIEDSNGGVVEMLKLDASGGTNGRPRLTFSNPSGTWFYEANGTNFEINRSGSGSPEELQLQSDGDLVIGGNLTELSSRTVKTGFEELDPDEVLRQVVELPVLSWSYKAQEGGARHVGPTAEDFYQAFELGEDDHHIAPSDKAGVALVAIQGLNRQLETRDQRKDRQIEILTERIEALEDLLRQVLEDR